MSWLPSVPRSPHGTYTNSLALYSARQKAGVPWEPITILMHATSQEHLSKAGERGSDSLSTPVVGQDSNPVIFLRTDGMTGLESCPSAPVIASNQQGESPCRSDL